MIGDLDRAREAYARGEIDVEYLERCVERVLCGGTLASDVSRTFTKEDFEQLVHEFLQGVAT